VANWGWQSHGGDNDATNFLQRDSYHAADGDLFEILTFDALAGNVKRAFNQSIHRSDFGRRTAMKYFGRTDVAGEVLNRTGFKSFGRYTIDLSPVRDFPTNSSYDFK